MKIYITKEIRNNQLFLRNKYEKDGRYNIPLIKKQEIDLSNIQLISYSDTKSNDNGINKQKGVHFL